MPRPVDLILKDGTVVNHEGTAQRDIIVHEGRIVVASDAREFSAAETVNCAGLHILPGVIDSQVHFREPGAEHKEDLETGSRAAVMGGVTSVFEMPNTNPLTVSEATLADKVQRASNRMFCDFAFYMGGTRENAHQLAAFEKLQGCAGIKVFMGSSTGSLLVEDDAGVRDILAHTTRRAVFHSEDEFRLRERMGFRVEGDAASHPVWRDVEAARLCTERLIRIAQEQGKRIHVLHISTGDEMPLIAANRDIVSAEVTPHHLTLNADDYARLGTRLQMNPPVRGVEHQRAIWKALLAGTVDVLGSDHAPHALEEKAKPYPASPSGMPGVQTLVPVMLNHVSLGSLTLERFVDLTSHGPHRIFGLKGKGRIEPGYDADFTIVDLKKTRVIENKWIASRCGWTPYDGMRVTGWPIGTFVRGRRVMWDDEITGAASGQPVKFREA